MKKIFHTVTMAALLVAATSCEHKELCLDHAHAVEVEVVFDWRNAPNAAPASIRARVASTVSFQDFSVRTEMAS